MRRNFYEHMDVIGRQYATNYRNTHFFANLANNCANSLTYFSTQNLVSIFWSPNNMVAMMKNCVTIKN